MTDFHLSGLSVQSANAVPLVRKIPQSSTEFWTMDYKKVQGNEFIIRKDVLTKMLTIDEDTGAGKNQS